MWIKLSEITKFFYIPEKLMCYRKHSDQQSHLRRQWEDGFIVLYNAKKRHPYSYKTVRKRYAVLFFRLGVFDWKHQQYLKALKNMFFASLLDPVRTICDIKKAKMIFKVRTPERYEDHITTADIVIDDVIVKRQNASWTKEKDKDIITIVR